MAKKLITANDVEAVNYGGQLVVPNDALITPLARDKAREASVTIVRECEVGACSAPTPAPVCEVSACGAGEDDLAVKVRAIVASLMAAGGAEAAPCTTKYPVVYAKKDDFVGEPFFHPEVLPPGMEVTCVDAVTGDNGSPMAAGYMTMTKGEFPWTLNYDEVQIVLEGELHIGSPDGVKVGKPGDMFYVPKGSSITFGTPSWTKFIYVTFPANWEG